MSALQVPVKQDQQQQIKVEMEEDFVLSNNSNSNTTSIPINPNYYCCPYGQTTSTIWGPVPFIVVQQQQQQQQQLSCSTRTTQLQISIVSNETKLKQQQSQSNTDIKLPIMEVSVHTLPKPLLREFKHVFSNYETIIQLVNDNNNNNNNNTSSEEQCQFLAITTNQHSLIDLVSMGTIVENEKDRLLNVFIQFASILCQQISNNNKTPSSSSTTNTNTNTNNNKYWADYIDPCSGLPMVGINNDTSNNTKVYSEVDGMVCCLGYKCYNAGFCKILTHPLWGSSIYPATIFVYAPPSYIIKLLQQFPIC